MIFFFVCCCGFIIYSVNTRTTSTVVSTAFPESVDMMSVFNLKGRWIVIKSSSQELIQQRIQVFSSSDKVPHVGKMDELLSAALAPQSAASMLSWIDFPPPCQEDEVNVVDTGSLNAGMCQHLSCRQQRPDASGTYCCNSAFLPVSNTAVSMSAPAWR